MIRVIPVAAAMLFGVAPLAQAATCSEQMSEVSKMINSAMSATKKQAAMQEMDQAKAALAKADENGCIAHVSSAKKRMVDVD